jgi:UTP--glucose-1-phosphate uridylyltransferase
MRNVKKAVIPAAGLGTRFLPATKSTPKEMLPIVDRPIILHVVEEAVRAGIEDIIIVAGRGKHSIEDFFDRSYELEDQLQKTGKTDVLKDLQRIRSMANIISIRQKEALGLGHAVLCAEPIVGKDSFAVLLGDEIMLAEAGDPTVTEQLANTYNDTQVSCVAVMEVPPSDVHKYGIIDGHEISPGRFEVRNVVEKPELKSAPSRWALPGRYVFSSEIFSFLRETRPGKNGEIQLTDAMTGLAKSSGLHATTFKARRYDAGDKLGYLIANLEFGLRNPELSDGLRQYLNDRILREKGTAK